MSVTQHRPGKRLTCEERIRTFTPILCRLLAMGDNGKPLSTDEIAFLSGLPKHVVDYLSHGTAWDNFPVGQMILFAKACGINFFGGSCRRTDEYLRAMSKDRRNAFYFLSKSPRYEDFYLPLLIKWREAYPEDPPHDIWPPVRKILARLTPLLYHDHKQRPFGKGTRRGHTTAKAEAAAHPRFEPEHITGHQPQSHRTPEGKSGATHD